MEGAQRTVIRAHNFIDKTVMYVSYVCWSDGRISTGTRVHQFRDCSNLAPGKAFRVASVSGEIVTKMLKCEVCTERSKQKR